MKSGQKWVLIGAGAVGAVGLAALGVGLSCRYMVRLAMDRETPRYVRRELDRVSGSAMGPMVSAMLACGRSHLEKAGCTTVETESHDGLRLVGHWLEAPQPKRIIVADTDGGKRVKETIRDLEDLLNAYRSGELRER